MTKKDTKKFITNAVIFALVFGLIYALFEWIGPKSWSTENCMTYSTVVSIILGLPYTIWKLGYEKKKEGEEWDGGLGFTGTWGSTMVGSIGGCAILSVIYLACGVIV